MVDQLTSWPIARVIPDKKAVTVANTVYKDLILRHRAPEILLSDNGKEFSNDTLAYDVRNMVSSSTLLVPIHQGLMGKQRTLINS